MSGWGRAVSGGCLALVMIAGPACAKKNRLNLEMTREVVITKPTIKDVTFEPGGLIDTSEAGRTINVQMTGDERLQATYDLEGTSRRLLAQPMREVEPGLYSGQFEVMQGEKGKVWVSGHLLHPPTGARQDYKNEEPLELRANPPAPPVPACDDAAVARFTESLRALTTHFEFNKFSLSPEARGILDGSAEILASQPLCLIEVHGHADDVGSPQYNIELSKNRATTVAAYLESRGVPVSRMLVQYHGEDVPVDTSGTPEARALNRRVELHAAAPR